MIDLATLTLKGNLVQDLTEAPCDHLGIRLKILMRAVTMPWRGRSDQDGQKAVPIRLLSAKPELSQLPSR